MFKLNIECTKDIDELHINFSDGTCSIMENKPSKTPRNPTRKIKSQDDEINWDEYTQDIEVESILPPPIPEIDEERNIKVAGEMMNVEF